MHDGRKIANLLLSEFDSIRFDLTNLKLNKVLYYVHAFHLVRRGRPIIKNHFEAWEHGPVIRVVYQEFKTFGNAPITKLARYLNYETGREEVIDFADVEAGLREFILSVATHYMQFTASQLREMTHKPGGPWHQVYISSPESRGLRDRIPNDLIQNCFASEIGLGGRSLN